MDKDKEVLIEYILFNAISVFHDMDDPEKRKEYARDYFLNFCKTNKIDLKEACDVLNKMLDNKRKTTQFKYKNYEGDKLNEILLGKDDKKSDKKSDDTEPQI